MYLKKENNRHSERYHFRENAWSGDDKIKTDRHGEAGDASAGATKPSPPRDTPHGLCYRFLSRGLLHAAPKATRWVRDDDK